MKKKLILVVGTRPELIKIAPVVKELDRRGKRESYLLVNTAQHKDLLDPYWEIFKIQADLHLDVMQKKQSLSGLTVRVMDQFQIFVNENYNQIGGIMAQGDTTTVLGVSMVSFFNQIPFYHLEAGLRSYDLMNPYPEEFNRKVASISARIHFCPTEQSRNNLLREGYSDSAIRVVGNTIVDALQEMEKRIHSPWKNKELGAWIDQDRRVIFVTCHRRENQGQNLLVILETVQELALENPIFQFVWIMHPNPNVFKPVSTSTLSDLPNVLVSSPLSYTDLLKLLSISALAISDSGGIQEEAPSFGVPVLVLREATERPEGINAGLAILVGADKELIKKNFYQFIQQKNNISENPYGDGKAAGRVVDCLLTELAEEEKLIS